MSFINSNGSLESALEWIRDRSPVLRQGVNGVTTEPLFACKGLLPRKINTQAAYKRRTLVGNCS